ncbi:hypothetical protein BDC45DRAFT_493103 [Circinella umbellata]|nr:hypothetical protein BDC45DRAFT_493103 [Circinella umbellata]
MPRRNQQQSSPFIHRVFLPNLRSTLLALAVLAISFGSWLETNDSFDDNCSMKDNFSIQKVTLLRNLSDDSFSPDVVTFGLWKHCFIYALNCTCTPSSLTYEPDTSIILEAAIGNHTAIPITDNDQSYWRVIPFALATVLGAIAFILGVVANRLENEKLQWCNVGLVIGTTILLVIGSGYTFHQYSLGIQNACQQLDHPYCLHIDYGTEFIVLVIGIGLIGLALLLWIYAPFSTKKQKREKQEQENESTDEYYSTMGVGTSQKLKKKGTSSNTTMSSRPTSDVLEPWRDVALFDEKLRSDTSYRPIQDDNYSSYDDYNNTNNTSANIVNNGPLPPPPSNSNRYRQRQSIQDSYYDYSHEQQKQRHQRHQHYNRRSSGEEILQPPSRPFVSSQRRSSHGSGNTFGANNMLRNSRGSSIMMEENDYYYSSGGDSDGNHSPIIPSSSRRRSSSAMSPYPSNNNYPRSQSPYSRPGTAPVGTNTTTHPLNRKVITDQRISAYLQQQQQ